MTWAILGFMSLLLGLGTWLWFTARKAGATKEALKQSQANEIAQARVLAQVPKIIGDADDRIAEIKERIQHATSAEELNAIADHLAFIDK